MGDYYMTNSGAKKYKRSRVCETTNKAKAEEMVRRAMRAQYKGIELKKGTKEFRNGRHTVYRVYVAREG